MVQAELAKAAYCFPRDPVLSSATIHTHWVFLLIHKFFSTLQLQVPALTRIGPDATACTPVILLGHGHLPPAQRQKTTCMSPVLMSLGTRGQALAQVWVAKTVTCFTT